eukprot:218331_1
MSTDDTKTSVKPNIHSKITLKCMIGPNAPQLQNALLTRKTTISESERWQKNMTSILKKATKLTAKTDIKWVLSINAQIIKQTDSRKLGEILRNMPTDPTVIVSIIEAPFEIEEKEKIADSKVIKVDYNGKSCNFELPSDDWDANLKNLKSQISDHFDVWHYNIMFLVDEDECHIEDGDELEQAVDELDDQMLQIFVKAHSFHSQKDDAKDNEVNIDENKDAIKDELYDLGSFISSLGDQQKKEAHGKLDNIMGEIMKAEHNLCRFLSTSLNAATKTSIKYAKCIQWFLRIIGYQIDYNENNNYIVSGEPDKHLLNEIASKFCHVGVAIQNPKKNIYEQLNIKIPNTNTIETHDSGINDNQFIIFELYKIVTEEQESSVEKK